MPSIALRDFSSDPGQPTHEENVADEKRTFRKLAAYHVAAGTISIALSLAAIGVSMAHEIDTFGFTFVSAGTWCGFLFVVAGSASHLVAMRRKEKNVTCAWCTSAMATLFACTMFSLELATAATFSSKNCCLGYQLALVLLHAFMSAVACFEILVAVVTCAYCCKVFCCISAIFKPQVNYISGSDSVPFVREPIPSMNALTSNNASQHLSSISKTTTSTMS